ncbi:hypothetical protein [Pedobacter faecalis]|uniref:hypothetical protein n=1 Tax=Pedobacter faecalis TaxID=3041495 RepID=UPI002550B0F5|nr:hypothetical protein [Pedobacter sp. ELA7]
MQYTICRNGHPILICRPTGQREREVMVKNIVSMQVRTPNPVHFQHGDYVTVWGETYTLNRWADVTKASTTDYTYNLEFQAQYYSLAKWKYKQYNYENELTEEQFELNGTLEDFLDLAIANANAISEGWSKGEVEADTGFKLLAFNGENILQALAQLAEAFETEWWVDNKVISLKRRGQAAEYTFEYRKGIAGGLERTNASGDVFSRLNVYGSEQNIPANYRGGRKRLTIPSGTYIQGPKYGPDEIEESVTFDDIRPEYVGTVTATSDMYTITDTGIDFDINAHLYGDLSAKITFLTGQLAGYVFEIAKGGYNHTTRTIKFNKNEMEKAFELPSEDLHAAVGDTFSLFDIQMPTAYVTAAEARLLERGTEYFQEESIPKCTYKTPTDHVFFDNHSIALQLGNYYHIKDHDVLLDGQIRAVGFDQDLHDEYKYTNLKLSNVAVKGSPIVRQANSVASTRKALNLNKIGDINRARLNWRTTNELTSLLNTLRAEMLLITLDGGSYQTSVSSTLEVDEFVATDGQIVHEQYTDNGGIWTVTGITEALEANQPYYVYIKAYRNSQLADVIVSLDKIGVEDDPDYYHFPYGIISSIFAGQREFVSLRGRTSAVAGTLSTGRIESASGQTYIDLDNDRFNIGDLLSGMDWGVTNDGQLTIRGQVIATGAEFINLIVKNLRTNATGKRVQILESENNIKLISATEQELLLIDDDSAIETNNVTSTTIPILPKPRNFLYQKLVGGVMTYFYAAVGPGVSVGITPDDAAGFSSMGRKGFETTGHVQASTPDMTQVSKMTKEGIETTGTLSVGGNVVLSGSSIKVGEGERTGVSITLDGVRVGGSDYYTLEWLNGILVRCTLNP